MTAPQTTVLSSAARPGRGIREGLCGRLLCLLALIAALLASGAATARGATVTTTVCGAAPNHVFAPYSEDSNYGSSDCQPGISNQLLIAGGNVGGQHAGGFKVDALPGTAFVDYHIASYGPRFPNNGWQQVIDGLGPAGEYQTHYRCGYQEPQGNCAVPHDTFANGAVARQLRILLFCAVPSFAYGAPQSCGQSDNVVVYGAVLVIEDDNGAGLFDKSGAVLSRGIWHHASDKLIGRVSNGAEGISNVTATLDGAPTTTTTSCDYHALRVCPDAGLSTTLDGATDGNHHLTVVATTASGIVTTLYDDPTYTVDSTPPTAPLNVALDAPGERYAPAAARTLSWTNPTGQVAPITHAVVHVCRVDTGQCRDQTADGTNVQQATITPWGGGGVYRLTVVLQDQAGNINDGPGGQSAPVMLRFDQRPYSALIASATPLGTVCHRVRLGHRRARPLTARHRRFRACHLVAHRARRVVRVRFGARIRVYAALTDAGGHPLGHQPIQVVQQVRGPATTFTAVGAATTDAAGQLTYRVDPGPSRTLRLVYPGSDAIKASVGDINIRVPAHSSFHVDRGTAHLHQPVVFTGQVKGGPIPEGGVAVQLEGRDYRTGWIPVSPAGKLRTDRSGHWHYTFAAQRQSGPRFTYPFRLAILADPRFPYLPSTTKPKLVTILNP